MLSILRRLGLIQAGAPERPGLSLSGVFETRGINWQQAGDKPVAAVWNVSQEKRGVVARFLRDYRVAYALRPADWEAQRPLLEQWPRLTIMVWGMSEPPEVRDYAMRLGIPLHRLADGFVGQIQRDGRPIPLSIALDRVGIHFDASRPSELENLLNTYDFDGDPKIVEAARLCMEKIRLHGLTKRHAPPTNEAELLYGPKVRPRILVVGHVESRPSAQHSRATPMTNPELVGLAAEENPGAQILYSPHPELVARKRGKLPDSSSISHRAEIVSVPMSLKDALHEVDRVYTVSSLAGFEALIYGVPVTTTGSPFYSGWGLTDDRENTGRRNRKLSLEQVFAGAYLLYSRYLDPVTHDFTDLPAALESIRDFRLATAARVAPDAVLSRLRLFNMATRTQETAEAILESGARSIVIIADNAGALAVAKAMAGAGKKVTLLCIDDAMANSQQMSLSLRETRELAVASLGRRYASPLSALEAASVELARRFSTGLASALGKVMRGHASGAVIEPLAAGLQDFIYLHAVRFHAARSCLADFDATLLLIRDTESHIGVIRSFHYHGVLEKKSARLYLSSTEAGAGRLFDLLQEESEPAAAADADALNAAFGTLWRALLAEATPRYAGNDDHIAICGNIANDNYAYAPASWKLIETLLQRSRLPIVFYSSDFPRASSQDAARKVFSEKSLGDRCIVCEGGPRLYRERYGDAAFDQSSLVARGVLGLSIDAIETALPRRVTDIFKPRLERYTEALYTQLMFAADASVRMERCKLFATSMDRTTVSRILCALARERGIPTIGIQAQIMSVSPRYLASAVDRMGVVDTSQFDVYRELGTPPDALEIVGSVNYISKLQRIDDDARELGAAADRRTILFPMQHSSARQMIETAIALKTVVDRHRASVIVKPHPNQELPVMHEVTRVFAGSKAVSMLPPHGDTYAALARCGTVVGMNSNVLLEAALSGKPVVIAAFEDLHPSIDFSLLGVALKALDAAALERCILDIISDGPLARQLAISREEWMRRNPQFSRPYTYDRLESFIASALRA